MEAAARNAAAAGYALLKVKLGGDGDMDRIAAVRRGSPAARLIVDANEAWAGLDLEAQAAALRPHGVELIEQPVPAGEDPLLDGLRPPLPIPPDRSCQAPGQLHRPAARSTAH